MTITLEQRDSSNTSTLQQEILRLLYLCGPMSRYEIMEKTGRSSSTVHENLIKMEIAGLIQSETRLKDRKGRPPYYFKLKGVN